MVFRGRLRGSPAGSRPRIGVGETYDAAFRPISSANDVMSDDVPWQWTIADRLHSRNAEEASDVRRLGHETEKIADRLRNLGHFRSPPLFGTTAAEVIMMLAWPVNAGQLRMAG